MEKILFIVNPISGGKDKSGIEKLIQEHLNHSLYQYEIAYTGHPGHASELSKMAFEQGCKKFVAVGGDGTVNEVAKYLIGTDAAIGILPFGSGNGLARHLKIPMHIASAIKLLNHSVVNRIDTGKINGMHFVSTCGVGFDAHIGKVFSTIKGRGFMGYVKACLTEFANYVSQNYTLTLGAANHTHNAFLITFANASQYGNNAYIAPQADVQDGYLDICVMKPFPNWKMPVLSYHIFMKSIHTSSSMICYKEKNVVLQRSSAGVIHIDGEPGETGETIHVEIVPTSLNMICSKQ